MKCPSCGFDNLAGQDRCADCLHSLMQKDLPRPKKGDAVQNVMMTPVAELLTGEDLLVADPSDSVRKIVDIFQKEKKHCILVYQHKKIVGILSNRDILRKIAGKINDLSSVTVETVMTHHPEFVRPDEPIGYMVNKMALGGYRHVPVLREDGTPVSIIQIKDVFTYLKSRGC